MKPAYGKMEAPRCLRRHRKRMTSKPKVVGSSVGLVPTNAPVSTEPPQVPDPSRLGGLTTDGFEKSSV